MSPEVHKYLEKKAVHIHKHAIKKHRDNMKSLEVLVDTCRSQKGTGLKSMQKEPLPESYFHLQSTVGKINCWVMLRPHLPADIPCKCLCSRELIFSMFLCFLPDPAPAPLGLHEAPASRPREFHRKMEASKKSQSYCHYIPPSCDIAS